MSITAVGAHVLAHNALMKIIIKIINRSPDLESNLAHVFYDYMYCNNFL